MTSKNLCFDGRYMLDAIKRNIWFLVLICVCFFLTLPVGLTMSLQSIHHLLVGSSSSEIAVSIVNTLEDFLSANSFNAVILLLCGFIAALVFFGYLHNRRKIDFYHSQPFSRKSLFFINYFAGVAAVVIPYLVFYLITLVIVGVCGDIAYLSTATVLWGLILPILGFLVTYSIGVLAATLTGHLVIQGLVALYFMLIIPVVALEWIALMGSFFQTYAGDSAFIAQIVYWGSPLIQPLIAINVTPVPWLDGVVAAVASVLITAVALFFYRRRKGESAGRAFAFRKFIPFVKYPLIVLGSIGFAVFFYSLGEDGTILGFWMIFGALIGGLLISRALEAIIAFDIKAIKKHWGSFFACLAIVAMILGGFALDITGYDTYMPNPKEVKSVGVNIEGFDLYGERDDYEDSLDKGTSSVLLTGEGEKNAVYDIAKNGIDNLPKARELYQSGTVTVEEEYVPVTSAKVTFVLSSGRKVQRQYPYIEKKATIPDTETLLTSSEYREKQLAIFEKGEMSFENATYTDTQYVISAENLKKDSGKALAEAFYKDAKNLSLNEVENEMPIATISFEIKTAATLQEESFMEMTVPVYKSYKNILALLKEWGYDYETYGILTADMITFMTTEYYNDEDIVEQASVDPSHFSEVLDATVSADVWTYFAEDTEISMIDGNPADSVIVDGKTPFGNIEATRDIRIFWN